MLVIGDGKKPIEYFHVILCANEEFCECLHASAKETISNTNTPKHHFSLRLNLNVFQRFFDNVFFRHRSCSKRLNTHCFVQGPTPRVLIVDRTPHQTHLLHAHIFSRALAQDLSVLYKSSSHHFWVFHDSYAVVVPCRTRSHSFLTYFLTHSQALLPPYCSPLTDPRQGAEFGRLAEQSSFKLIVRF